MSEKLRDPQNAFQQTMRELAEIAMSVTHHDASEDEPGYIHEVESMERRFSRLLKGKLKSMRSNTPPCNATLQVPDSAGNAMRERIARIIAETEMEREGVPYSRSQEEFYEGAYEIADAILALPLDGRASQEEGK